MSRTVYINGEFVPESEAKLSIYDLSVMQAAAAFEMTRSFNGVHFKLREHLLRLEQSCKLLSIPMPCEVEYLEGICYEVSSRNDHGPGEEHRLLIVVSPGCAPMYRDLAGVIPHPFLYIADFPLRYTVQGFSKYFTEGVHCVTSNIQQVPDACIPSQAKHRSRLHFHLAQHQATAGTWPIMTTMNWQRWDQLGTGKFTALPEGRKSVITEAPGANICLVRGACIHIGQRNVLRGISAQTVSEICVPEYIGVSHARDWTTLDDAQSADELWLTGTPFCMLPVVSLDGKPIGNGTIGPVYTETLRKWSALVGVDIAQQIIDWDTPSPLWTPEAQRKCSAV